MEVANKQISNHPIIYTSIEKALQLIGLALFIIGFMGISGAFPGANMGWSALVLASDGFLLQFVAMNLIKKECLTKRNLLRIHLLGLAVFATYAISILGGLGGAGILSNYQVRVGIVVSSFLAIILAGIWCKFLAKNSQKR